MKVLHLTTHLNVGGITSYILRLIGPLQKHGIETHVLSSGGELVPAFQELGAMVHELPIRTKNELHPKLYWAIPKILSIVRENGIDLLHAHTRVAQVMSLWIQKITGIGVVTTCHGFYKQRLGRRLIPAWGDRVIAISQPVEQYLIENFKIPRERRCVIYNAVDIDLLLEAYHRQNPADLRRQFGFGLNDPVLGVIARLVKDKGQDYLIRAVDRLRKSFSSIRLLIVGEGREKENLRQLVQYLGLQNQVVFTNNLLDVTQALAVMDIFVFPPTWREGFGLSIVEAMACSKPVVVTNIWALNSIIQDGVNGILVEPKQVDALTYGISLLLNNPQLSQSIGSEGKQMVENRFSIRRMAKEIAEVYKELSINP